MRITAVLILGALLLAGPPLVSAEETPEATAEIAGTNVRVHGTVESAGGMHDFTIFVPADSTLGIKVKKEKKADDPRAEFTVTDPEGAPVLLERGGKARVALTGKYGIRVRAGDGLTGAYRMDVKVAAGKKAAFKGELADGEQTGIAFGALGGALVSTVVKGADAIRLHAEDPEDLDLVPNTPKEKNVPVPANGAYTLVIEGRGATAKATVKIKTPREKRTELWISPDGYGPAPEIGSVTPDEGLDSDPDVLVTLEGDGFEKGATATLEKNGLSIPGYVDPAYSGEELRVSFDLTGLKKGKWDLCVENPSGARQATKFLVVKTNKLRLPDGVKDDTEVWFLDFTPEFASDLADFGLAGSSDAMNRKAAEAVKAYIVYLLRYSFGLPGRTGAAQGGSVPVSFVISKPPDLAGDDYNRIVIGGKAGSGDPSSNPSIPWGNVPVDEGNQQRDDIRDPLPGEDPVPPTAKVPVADMAPTPSNTNVTEWFRETFRRLRLSPIEVADADFYRDDPRRFLQSNVAIDRNALIVNATERLGREIAAVIAHHVANAMGVPASGATEGIMSQPTRFGNFAAVRDLSFTESELTTLRENAKPSDLPGESLPLNANSFQVNPGIPILFEAYSGVAFEVDFMPIGGRPERLKKDYSFEFVGNTLPTNFLITSDARLIGQPPTLDPSSPSSFPRDAVLLQVKVEDKESSAGYVITHRLNVLIDITQIPDAILRQQAETLNDSTRNGPAR